MKYNIPPCGGERGTWGREERVESRRKVGWSIKYKVHTKGESRRKVGWSIKYKVQRARAEGRWVGV